LDALQATRDAPPRSCTLLHCDLYRENILFDTQGSVVFIDPYPRIGDHSFDWAFWTLYYDLSRGQRERFELAVGLGDLDASQLVTWCRLLALDGLLYYESIGDLHRSRRMGAVIEELAGWPC
jgi:streptomycin 6-kinase